MSAKETIVDWYKLRKKLSVISTLINMELDENSYQYSHSEISLKCIKSLSISSKLPAFILLKTYLRFGDLFNLDLYDIIHNNRIILFQNKTHKLLQKEFIIHLDQLRFQLVAFDNWHQVINYQTLSNEIRRFTRRYSFFDTVEWKHSAHFFRHVEASYLFSKDIPISIIAKELGDLESTVKNNYIHKELLSLFS